VKSVVQTKVDYSWRQTLRMPEFYLLYFIHFLISLGGLMTLGNLSEIARSLQVEKATVSGFPSSPSRQPPTALRIPPRVSCGDRRPIVSVAKIQ